MIYRGHIINEFGGYLQPYNVVVQRGPKIISLWFTTEDEARNFIDQEADHMCKTVTEWCANCEYEVELPNVFQPHKCPNCDVVIYPCAQCEGHDCAKCPLDKED